MLNIPKDRPPLPPTSSQQGGDLFCSKLLVVVVDDPSVGVGNSSEDDCNKVLWLKALYCQCALIDHVGEIHI